VVAQVSGGEPLLRKDLEDVISAIRIPGHDPLIVLTTNGVLLTKERYRRLLDAGVDEFSLSLDYPDERHDDFRQVPGLFQRIKGFVGSLDKEGEKRITLACVVQSDNFRDLPKMAELARTWGVKVNFSCYTCLRTQNTDYMIGGDKLDEFKSVVEDLRAFKRRHNTIRTSDYVFENMIQYFQRGRFENCRAGERFIVVNPDGTLSPCGLVLRNLTSQEEVRREFNSHNKCELCYTSIRANSERPAWYLVKDNLSTMFRWR
jgi:MoaA/NifB/PqqE/SkfB family radical SAM enzyme